LNLFKSKIIIRRIQMPRINIHEVDNTKPGSRAYSNFTVVVPGFHAPYFDEKTDDAGGAGCFG
jgi:hypothetical protein